MASSGHPGPVEVLILGPVIVRSDGAEVALTPALAKTLILLGARGGPVRMRELERELDIKGNPVHQKISGLGRQGVPVLRTGRGDTCEYCLDLAKCSVDAAEFVRGVDDGQDIDELLCLWRGPVPRFPRFLEKGLDSPFWSKVKDARSRLIRRVSELSDADRGALSGLARFADLFPGDQEIGRIRPSEPVSQPWLLVVEDNPEMLDDIRGQLETSYRLHCLRSIEEWRDFRANSKAQLEQIDGALLDLSLTRDNDMRGLEIAGYLRDKTEIPVALVTANRLASSDNDQRDRMAEYRLVDIVSKQSPDWNNALEAAARRLVGDGPHERRLRMETWLIAAHRKVRRETSDASPGSVAHSRREACDREFETLLGRVKVRDVDATESEVRSFCRKWGRSG